MRVREHLGVTENSEPPKKDISSFFYIVIHEEIQCVESPGTHSPVFWAPYTSQGKEGTLGKCK